MLIKTLADSCDVLSRFALIRENAPEPQDRVVIQQVGGRLKFIGGSDTMTVVVDCGESVQNDFRAVVSSRVLLSAGRALKGKGEVSVARTEDGAVLRTSTGGEVTLPNVASRLPVYVRPVLDGAHGKAPAGLLTAARQRASAVADAQGWLAQVTIGVEGGAVSVRAMDRHMYAEHPANGLDGAEELPVPTAFVEALLPFKDAADIYISGKTITVVCGNYTAVTAALDTTPVPRWPDTVEDSSVIADRKGLIEMVKGTAPHDQYNRVALTASGSSISSSPWGKDDTGIRLPAKVDGAGGRIGVTADYLLKLLGAIPTPKVGLAWKSGETGVVRVFGENDPWRQLLAPVAL